MEMQYKQSSLNALALKRIMKNNAGRYDEMLGKRRDFLIYRHEQPWQQVELD